MNVYVISSPNAGWCQDYAVAVIAENIDNAMKLVKEYSSDFKDYSKINVTKIDVNKEQAILAANVGA